MQSSFKILSALYRILNVPAVNDRINGKVYIGEPPLTSQLEDVSIHLLTNANSYLQNGYCNVNIHIPMLAEGRHNLFRAQILTDVIFPLVEDARIATEDGTFFFQIDDDKGFFKDRDRDNMSYYNIRLNFQT